jgi:hypothetical protein
VQNLATVVSIGKAEADPVLGAIAPPSFTVGIVITILGSASDAKGFSAEHATPEHDGHQPPVDAAIRGLRGCCLCGKSSRLHRYLRAT